MLEAPRTGDHRRHQPLLQPGPIASVVRRPRRRQPGSITSQEKLGYTGHEHLDDVGIIHMNGRIYSPSLGRMLSPDPVTFAPEDAQGYSRYSYVLNNPLRYTDPSGFQPTTIAPDEPIGLPGPRGEYPSQVPVHRRTPVFLVGSPRPVWCLVAAAAPIPVRNLGIFAIMLGIR